MIKLIDKFKTKQFGLLLIILGAFIPSIFYPFTSLTPAGLEAKVAFAMKGISYDTRLQELEVVLVKGEWKGERRGGYYEGRIAIPYRYPMALGILLAFIGIGIVAFYKNRRETD